MEEANHRIELYTFYRLLRLHYLKVQYGRQRRTRHPKKIAICTSAARVKGLNNSFIQKRGCSVCSAPKSALKLD